MDMSASDFSIKARGVEISNCVSHGLLPVAHALAHTPSSEVFPVSADICEVVWGGSGTASGSGILTDEGGVVAVSDIIPAKILLSGIFTGAWDSVPAVAIGSACMIISWESICDDDSGDVGDRIVSVGSGVFIDACGVLVFTVGTGVIGGVVVSMIIISSLSSAWTVASGFISGWTMFPSFPGQKNISESVFTIWGFPPAEALLLPCCCGCDHVVHPASGSAGGVGLLLLRISSKRCGIGKN